MIQELKFIIIFTIIAFKFEIVVCQNDLLDLRIDSLYLWRGSSTTDSTTGENYEKYIYDQNNLLIETRNLIDHSNYYYNMDTIITVRSFLLEDIITKNTAVYKDGERIFFLYEIKTDNGWVNKTQYFYYQNSFGKDSLKLTQNWENSSWSDWTRKEYKYDSEERLIEEREVISYGIGSTRSNIKQVEYINLNNISSEFYYSLIDTDTVASGVFISYSYKNGRLDSTANITYFAEDGLLGNGVFTSYILHHYLKDSTIVNCRYKLIENKWVEDSKSFRYSSKGDTPFEFDSIILYRYNIEFNVYSATQKWYYSYDRICNDKILKEEETYLFDRVSNNWRKIFLKQEWYTIKGLETQNIKNIPVEFMLYPNPCKQNEFFDINLNDPINQVLSVHVYDMKGQLISKGRCGINARFDAPKAAGIYIVTLFNGDKVWKSKKLLVE